MNSIKMLIGLCVVALVVGCNAPRARFEVAFDINGQTPEAARFPIFGAGQILIDGDGDGVKDDEFSQILLLSSDRRDLCEELAALQFGNDTGAFGESLLDDG